MPHFKSQSVPIEYQLGDYFPDPHAAVAVFRRQRATAVLPHHHAFDEWVFILSGSGLHVVDEMALAFRAGDVLKIPAGCRHHYRNVHGLSIACLLVIPERLKSKSWKNTAQVYSQAAPARPQHARPSPKIFNAMLDGLAKIERLKGPECRYELTMLLHLMIACEVSDLSTFAALGLQPDIAQTLATGLRHLEANFTAPDPLAPLCDLVKMSPRTLLRRFHEVTGRSPVRYLADLRMHHAMLELRRSPRSVLAVALDCGFNDLSYFHRRFHRATGETPRVWRHLPSHCW